VAGDFTKYDQYAVQQIRRNIELIRYRRYGDDLVLLELITGGGELSVTDDPISPASNAKTIYKTVSEFLEQADPSLQDLFESVRAFLMAFGDDVQMNVLKNYFAFKRLKNFACVEVHAKTKKLLIFVKSEPDSVEIEQGFTRDVRHIGHFGTGDLEITIKSYDDFERAKPMMVKSYEAS